LDQTQALHETTAAAANNNTTSNSNNSSRQHVQDSTTNTVAGISRANEFRMGMERVGHLRRMASSARFPSTTYQFPATCHLVVGKNVCSSNICSSCMKQVVSFQHQQQQK
jgi:hypothetical protein